MLSGFRKFAKSKLALVLFGGLIVAFGFGVGTSDPFQGIQGGGFLRAGDRSIGVRDVNRLLDRQIDNMREQSGEVISQRQAAERGITGQIVQELQQQTQALAFMDKMGVRGSAAAVTDLISTAPRFKDALGRVNMDEVARYASEQKQSVAEFQSDIADSLTLGYLDRALFSGLTTPQILTKSLTAYLGESRTLNIARLTRTSVAEPKPPTETELQAFYTDRNAVFAQPERRRISVLSYTPEDFVDKVEISEADLKSEYDRRIREFSGPETRVITQLTSADQNKLQTVVDAVKLGETIEAAAAKVPGLELVTLTVKPADLTDVQYSGYVFSLPVNEMAGPVKVGETWFGVQVKTITPGEAQSFESVKDQLRSQMALRDAERLFSGTEESFYDLSGGATSLEDIAKDIGAPVIQLAPIDANGGMERIRPSESNVFTRHPDALKSMFSLKVGELSDVIEANNERALFRLDEIVAPRTPPLDEVRGDLTQLYLAVKTQEAALKVADDMVAAVKAGATFEAAAASAKMAAQKLPPLLRASQNAIDPAIMNAAFSLAVGETAVAKDQRGEPWVVRVESSAPATPDVEGQLNAMVTQEITKGLSQDVTEAFARGVQKAVKVKANEKAIGDYLASFTKDDETQ